MIKMTKLIVCRECGEQIFFIRTQSGAKVPVNKDQVGYNLGGKDRIVTPNGEIIAVTITDHPESGVGYVPHWRVPAVEQTEPAKYHRCRRIKRKPFQKKAYFRE